MDQSPNKNLGYEFCDIRRYQYFVHIPESSNKYQIIVPLQRALVVLLFGSPVLWLVLCYFCPPFSKPIILITQFRATSPLPHCSLTDNSCPL